MKGDNRMSDAQLREWLRRGDPGSETTPDASAFDRIRRQMVLEIPTPRPRILRRSWATALALTALFVLLSRLDLQEPTPTQRATPTPTVEGAQIAPTRQARQIQFVTARGMRVFWTLDQDLDS